MTTYVVKDEHTLGYMVEEHPQLMGVLAGLVRKGGHDPMNGPITITLGVDQIRNATFEDFNTFRVAVPTVFLMADHEQLKLAVEGFL